MTTKVEIPRAKLDFFRVSLEGQFCYFTAIDYTYHNGTPLPNGMSMLSGHTSARAQQYVIDLHGETINELSKEVVLELIKDEQTLYNNLGNKKDKKIDLKSYLSEYSDKHLGNLVAIAKTLNFPEDMNHSKTPRLKDASILPSKEDKDMDAYFNRILSFAVDPDIENIELKKELWDNGTVKSIGLIASHKIEVDNVFPYKVGVWRQYYSNGQLMKEIEYNLWGKKNGIMRTYGLNGDISKELKYENGVKIKNKN